jgi:hypothetical protein
MEAAPGPVVMARCTARHADIVSCCTDNAISWAILILKSDGVVLQHLAWNWQQEKRWQCGWFAALKLI